MISASSTLRQVVRRMVAVVASVCLALALGGGGVARAQPAAEVPVDPELKAILGQYDHGHYDVVLSRARARIDRGNLSRDELVQLHQYAGLSAFNLGDEEAAKRHFAALLRLDPDFGLDPYAVAPPAIVLFGNVKEELEPQLEIIRQQRRVEADRLRREAEERARRQRDEELRRRRLEDLSRQVTVRNVEKRSFLVNFVPFGAGQFQQKRNTLGTVLASSQAVAAVTSIAAYLVIESMIVEQTFYVDTLNGRELFKRRGIPQQDQAKALAWSYVKYASAGAFYTLYGYGVVDGIYHHQPEVVETTTVQIPLPQDAPDRRDTPLDQPLPEPSDTGSKSTPTPTPTPADPPRELPMPPRTQVNPPSRPDLFLFPTPGGVGAGVHLTF